MKLQRLLRYQTEKNDISKKIVTKWKFATTIITDLFYL